MSRRRLLSTVLLFTPPNAGMSSRSADQLVSALPPSSRSLPAPPNHLSRPPTANTEYIAATHEVAPTAAVNLVVTALRADDVVDAGAFLEERDHGEEVTGASAVGGAALAIEASGQGPHRNAAAVHRPCRSGLLGDDLHYHMALAPRAGQKVLSLQRPDTRYEELCNQQGVQR
jgi:hypothetical protein